MVKYLNDSERASGSSEQGGMTRRSFMTSMAAGGMVLGGAGKVFASSTASTSGGSAAAPAKGGRLTIGVASSNSPDESLEAHRWRGSSPAPRLSALYDELRVKDTNFKPVNRLLEHIESNADATEWTLRLPAGVEFHNGKTASADDLMFTLNRIVDPANPQLDSAILSSIDPGEMKKLDDRTVRVKLKQPVAVFDEFLADGVALFLVPVDYDPANPVGTGPMKFKSFDPGQRSVFERFENYWGEPAHVDEFVVVNIADDNARLNALLSGQVDVIFPLPPSQFQSVTAGGAKVAVSPSGRPQHFVMNLSQAPFDDLRVREAMKLIPDRQAMIDSALDGRGRVGNDVFAMDDPNFNRQIPQRVQDLDRARFLLKQAGLEGANIEFAAAPIEGGAVEAAQIFVEHARQAGLNLELRTMPATTMWAKGPGNWALANGRFGALLYLSQTAFIQGPNPTWNDTHLSDPKFIELYNQALRETDAGKRADIMHAMMKRDHDEGGHIIWTYYDTAMGYSSKVAGFPEHDLSGRILGQGRDLSRLLHFTS